MVHVSESYCKVCVHRLVVLAKNRTVLVMCMMGYLAFSRNQTPSECRIPHDMVLASDHARIEKKPSHKVKLGRSSRLFSRSTDWRNCRFQDSWRITRIRNTNWGTLSCCSCRNNWRKYWRGAPAWSTLRLSARCWSRCATANSILATVTLKITQQSSESFLRLSLISWARSVSEVPLVTTSSFVLSKFGQSLHQRSFWSQLLDCQTPILSIRYAIDNGTKVFIVKWVNLRDSFLGTQAISFPKDKFRYFRSFFYNLLFGCWAFSSK